MRGCLDSIAITVKIPTYEIIVVDNASSDGSTDMLAREYPSVQVIANAENRGFGAANNQAFAVMKGRYALLINTDAVLTEGAVEKLWRFAESIPARRLSAASSSTPTAANRIPSPLFPQCFRFF